ncbi:MAG: M48 family metalloprotease [Acidobacteria bacterium]|nr:M48 family metalloprotease [Acidobacteriota bacterium]
MRAPLPAKAIAIAIAVLSFSDSVEALAAPEPTVEISDKDLFGKSLEASFQAWEFYGSYEQPELEARVRRIGYELAARSRFTEFPFTFFVVDMPIPNAFALPGGQVFVTSGMLGLDLDDDMLANLLGHEIAHVVHHHGTRMQKRAALIGLLSQALAIGVLATADNERLSPSDPYSLYGIRASDGASKAETAAAVSVVLGQLLVLSYSREFETEADDEGQRLTAAAGYDPDGARRLWQRMLERIPLDKVYGYWRTHPFEDSRMRAAEERAKYLKVQERDAAAKLRETTQAVLLDYGTTELGQADQTELLRWLEAAALDVWPQGPRAEQLRIEKLHRLRDEELEKPAMARNYGQIIEAYRGELEKVAALTPRSPFLGKVTEEIAGLKNTAEKLYPEAQRVLEGGVYETAFLEAFLGNFPDSPEAPRVAMALGNAYSRLRQPAAAVEQYLETLRTSPDSPEAAAARAGLLNLAAFLDDLSALEQLAQRVEDPELQQAAASRLAMIAPSYKDLANGATYLKKYPEGTQVAAVTKRLNSLADKLYTEVVVYQGVGDHAKALERMQQILTHAPQSPAADQLRERTALSS